MTEYCRLCAELKGSHEIVASINDVERSMEQKLIICCEWTLENTRQKLPHNVCAICFKKLEESWLFSQSVRLAQQKLLKIFGKREMNSYHSSIRTDILFSPIKNRI